MFERRNIKYIYLKLSRRIKDFLLSDKSREFLIFLFFFFIAGGFWLLQTLNNDYEAEFSIPVRLKGVPNHVVLTSEPPSELRIKVKDKGTVLLNYMLGKSFFPVNIEFIGCMAFLYFFVASVWVLVYQGGIYIVWIFLFQVMQQSTRQLSVNNRK